MRWIWTAYLTCGLCAADVEAAEAAESTCALTYSDLSQTPRLKSLQTALKADAENGFTNQTHGSYFVIDTREELKITFYTSVLFDLYRIRRSGVMKVCDTGQSLEFEAIGRTDKIVIEGATLTVGEGGPRKIFAPGTMPEALRKLASE